ncbi:MAG: polysaccharide biosynthesis protein, partial [Treponemataceae bacterium]|nr:polysaccharide biosynthesis protein [Treponemataceae bacterium]
GPVTVTDPGMKRFFMTIPEACSLVLEAGGVGENGKSYLLDMGEPIKIMDLAEQLIAFSGLEPHKDIEIKIIGVREGERLEEPLWLAEEAPHKTAYEKILALKNRAMDGGELTALLDDLRPICFFTAGHEAAFRDKERLLARLRAAVPTLDEFYQKNAETAHIIDRETNLTKVTL